MTAVWTVDKVGYPDECYQLGVAASEESAVALLKERYGSSYRVTWSEERDEAGALWITGKFEAVVGYSIEHEATYVVAKATVRP